MNAIDFFCGGGGMTRGLLDAQINVLFGIDSNPACQNTYEHNNEIPYLNMNIQDVTVNILREQSPLVDDIDELLLVGCAPCQPFSILNPRNPNEHISVNLLNEFGRFVREIHPAHILIENVASIGRRGQEVLDLFRNMLIAEGYLFDDGVINAKEYGVPQNRRRYILIGSRRFVPHIPNPTHGEDLLPYRTVYDAIHDYPPIMAGEENMEIPNHRAAGISARNLERMEHTPHDGGSRMDWPRELWLECHQDFSGHSDVYGRMSWNQVSPTLTSKCFSLSNGRFGHPEQNRAISLREAAALQTFNDDYIFEGSLMEIGKQIGNAVPVRLAEVLGGYILHEHENI